MEIINKGPKFTDENLTQQAGNVKVSANDTRLRDKFGNLCPPAVNTVHGCIQTYKLKAERQVKEGVPVTYGLKSISLNDRLWRQFEYWYRSMLPETQADAEVEMLTFFGVEIKKLSKFSLKEMDWDFWPSKKEYTLPNNSQS